MQAWITLAEAQRRFPDWVAQRGAYGWRSNGSPVLHPVVSNFGGFEVRVYLNPDGSPNHDKGVYFEAPNQNTVVWGRNRFGAIFIGCTIEERGFADLAGSTIQDPLPADPPMGFLQPCVMGFFNKILGSGLGEQLRPVFETGEQAAIREALEEAGVTEILEVKSMGVVWPNPTNTATVTQLYDMQIDLDKVVQNPAGREWVIKDCVWLSVLEVMKRIGVGEHVGVNCRMGQANSAFFTWLCRHPEALL